MIKQVILLSTFCIASISGCPTCVGRAMRNSTAPFFSEEHYAKYPADKEAGAQEYSSDEEAENARAETRP